MFYKLGRRSFTLVEILVSIGVFAVVLVAASGILLSVQGSWQRQTTEADLIRENRQAVDFMMNEIRQSGAISVINPYQVRFVPLPGTAPPYIFYWRGDGSVLGSPSAIYRGAGTDINQANLNRQELTNLVADNPAGRPVFSVNPLLSNLYIIELTLSKNNRSYSLRSQVRPKN